MAALSTATEVEALADAFGKSADVIHDRIMKAIKEENMKLAQARSLFQDETALRIKANALYLEAIKLVVRDLELEQTELIKCINKATSRMKTIDKISAFVDLVADLLVLAAATYAAKPGPIVAAFEEVRSDITALAKG
jgi:hypothetical protein